jgi:hypothetical protein
VDWGKIKPVHTIIHKTLQQFHKVPEAINLLRSLWPSVVGEVLSHHSRVTGIFGETLSIHVANGTIQQELSFQRIQILKKVQRIPGMCHIKKLRLRLNSSAGNHSAQRKVIANPRRKT